MGCCLRKHKKEIEITINTDSFKDFSKDNIKNYERRNSHLKFNQIAPKPPTPNGIIKKYIEYRKSSLSTEN